MDTEVIQDKHLEDYDQSAIDFKGCEGMTKVVGDKNDKDRNSFKE